MATIKIAGVAEYAAAIPRLAAILADAVAGGAGVSFVVPPSLQEGEAFWQGFATAIAQQKAFCFLAIKDNEIAGCVLLIKAAAANQPHRADICKLLVHSSFRRQGLGSLLMAAAEHKARDLKLTLLTFDAVAHGAVEQFYKDLGFTIASYYPGYAYALGQRLDDTALFYKAL